ncbi:molybdopterin molybdotransferase MoeA [Microbacterium paludicola]|uniref:Molybdopterin molybdenumtransferase n=1 Tax=Microbacterium paludicola TaxID=300019 RepID=A0A4Y9FYV4_9MICO|nr:gephyrin-like molybdotransferase Glp [Microbacterium paludicola]MBF0814864.1 molybdopterin molybdotransferase MoeA [Microbacterium paludicola]TFU34603.1 molybdopterin molybdotransferase MoeA [Microbacterium paludicola]
MTDDLLTIEQHLERILAAVVPTGTITLSLAGAAGLTLTEPVHARVDVPVFDNSGMDGFAVRFADVAHASPDAPVELRVVADLPAGSGDDPAIAAGEAVRIMTGSPVPSAADAIVPFEDTAGGLADSLGSVSVRRAPRAAGAHVRRRGEDLRSGDVVLPVGTELGPLQLSAAAAAGVDRVIVARPPRVIVISTGSELVEPGAQLERGQIPESNSTLLAGLVRATGAELMRATCVSDDPDEFRALLASGTDADLVITSGGVSAGAYEVVKQVLGSSDDGAEIVFAKVAMQPGKPQAFGRLSTGALLFGLPGNPVSVAVSFEAFVRPALLAMQGRAQLQRPVIRLPAAAAWRTPVGRRQYLPAVIDRSDPARWTVRPATSGGSGSHLAAGLAHAEAYAVVPAETEAVAEGDLVDVMLI